MDLPPLCIPNGEYAPRRKDAGRPQWNPHRPYAKVSTIGAMDNFAGLASKDDRPVEVFQTEQGPIALGCGERGDVTWMPTVSALNVAPYTDNRISGISDRYFK